MLNGLSPDPVNPSAVGELMVFGGSSARELTGRVCDYLQIEPGLTHIQAFPDGETFVKLDTDVRGRDCFVIQSTCPPVNDNLVELLIFIDCLRRASANRITAVIPYFGYARQDRKTEGRTPITAKMLANLITAAGAHRVLTMDLHADQIQGFFDIPLDHLSAFPVIAAHFKKLDLGETVIVSPDVGHLRTANRFAHFLGGDIAVLDKRRKSGDDVEMCNVIGEVEGKRVLMFDDIIATGGTLVGAARMVRSHGAKRILVGATHGVFARDCAQRLGAAKFEGICVTDTIPLRKDVTSALQNLTALSVSQLLGEAIRRIHRHESVSALFRSQE